MINNVKHRDRSRESKSPVVNTSKQSLKQHSKSVLPSSPALYEEAPDNIIDKLHRRTEVNLEQHPNWVEESKAGVENTYLRTFKLTKTGEVV